MLEILCEGSDVRGLLCMTARIEGRERSPEEVLCSLSETWFSSVRSTEPIMSGTANESALLSAFQV